MNARGSPPLAMQPWAFHNPVRILFGFDCRSAAIDLTARRRTLIVVSQGGRRRFEADPVLGAIAQGAISWVDDVEANPGLSELSRLRARAEVADSQAIIAFGGGSVMDSAKAISAMLACGQTGAGLREIIAEPSILTDLACPPIHCIPTTAGTGAEVTPFATVWDREARQKLSLSHPALYPATAMVDPALTLDLRDDVTLSTGLDALNQAFESVWNKNASFYTLGLAGMAVGKGLRALIQLSSHPLDRTGRHDMAQASMFAGLCISQTRTAVCHSISYPLTAHFGLAHGFACAFTMKAVVGELMSERPEVLEQFAPLAGYADVTALLRDLDVVLSLPPLRVGWRPVVTAPQAVRRLIPEMLTPGRSDNFVLSVDGDRLARILDVSLHQ